MKRDFCLEVSVEKYSNIKFHENSSSRSLVIPGGRKDGRTDRQTDMMMLVVAFCNFAIAIKNGIHKVLKVSNKEILL